MKNYILGTAAALIIAGAALGSLGINIFNF